MSEAAIGVAICPGVQPRRSYSRLHAIIADSRHSQIALTDSQITLRLTQAEEKEETPLNLDARAQAFLKRIAPISPPTAALAPWGWKKLHRICQAEVRRLKASYTSATVKFLPLQVPRLDPRRRTGSIGLAPKEDALRPAL